MTWLNFILGSLATFRLALLVSKEDGPYFIFKKIRKLPDKGTATEKGLACIFCTSIYSSSLVTLFFWWMGEIKGAYWILYWLAFSSVAIFMNQSFTKGDLSNGK